MQKPGFTFLVALGTMLFPWLGRAADYERVCGRVYMDESADVEFTDNEKKLMCGDSVLDAWKVVPYNQAEYHIKAFLQDRGYFHADFIVRRGDLVVSPGEKTFIKKITVIGAPKSVDIRKRRHLMNTELKPATLTMMERWMETRLKAKGYPCPHVESEADADEGHITLHVDHGPYQKLIDIEEEPIRGLNEEILRRYDAFRFRKPYNEDFLTVTANRTIEDGLLQNTYFSAECTEKGAVAVQHSIPGKPRVITLGFGASTEEFAIARGSWQHGRLGSMGSSLLVQGYGSYRKQQLEVSAKWYFLKSPSRWHFQPLLGFSHENEPKYRAITSQLRFTPATTWDSQNLGLRAVFGPRYHLTKTYRGTGGELGLTKFLSMHVDAALMSHYFEFYQSSPRKGFRVSLFGDLNHDALLSSLTAQHFETLGQILWNFRNLDPPLFVFGIRGGYTTTVVDTGDPNFPNLPSIYRNYLGGSRSLRGFKRQEVPDRDQGALTTAFASFELRNTGVLPYKLEPFIFMDVGAFGDRSFGLSDPVFFSPGFGIRWESPVGVVRATFAHGFMAGPVTDPDHDYTHPQVLLTFGEEF